MAIGVTSFVVAVLIAAVWLILGFKRFRHKFFTIFLIALILFTFISFSMVIKNKGVDLKTVSGMMQAGKLYFSWLGSVFGNFKTITADAIRMDWSNADQNKTRS